MPVVRTPFAARTDRDHCPTSTFSITIYFDSNETRSYVNSPLLSTRQEYYISLMCTGFWCGSGAALGHQIEKSNFAGETNCIFRGIWEAWEHERNWRALATCNNNIVQKKNLTVAMASLLTFDSVDVLWRYYWGKRHTKQVETSRRNAMHVARAVSLAC